MLKDTRTHHNGFPVVEESSSSLSVCIVSGIDIRLFCPSFSLSKEFEVSPRGLTRFNSKELSDV